MLDVQAWLMTGKTLFKGLAVAHTGTVTATTAEVGFGVTSATFETTPTTNIDSCTVSSSANGDSEYNLVLPNDGHILGYWHLTWESNSTGYRTGWPQLNSADMTAARIASAAVNGTTINQFAFFAGDLSAGDELSVDVFQNSGSALGLATWLVLFWALDT